MAVREWIRVGAVALVLGLVVGDAAAATPEGVLVVGQNAEPVSLDPDVTTTQNDGRILSNLYETLVRRRLGTMSLEPALATAWKISADGRTYTFSLRDGVHFHDGTPFDAAAVAFKFARMRDPDHPLADTGPFPFAFMFDQIVAVEVVDRLTVRFRLDQAYAPFLAVLAGPQGYLMSPAAVKAKRVGFGRAPVGTGPFRFAVWEANRQVALARNDAYWGAAPALRGLVFRPIADQNARIGEMLAGNLDLMVEVPADSLRLFRNNPAYDTHAADGPHLWFLILNTREGPFADRRMRRALMYALNRRALADDVLAGSARVATSVTAPAFAWAANPALEPYPYDPARARELIRAAGYGDGVSVTLYATESGSGMLDPLAMATAMQADLAAVGVQVTIETFEWNSYLARVNRGLGGQADMAQMAWMTMDPDFLPYLALRTAAWPEAGGFNSGYYANPTLDRLIVAARTETDRAERAALYREIDRIAYDEVPWAFVANARQLAVTRAEVGDFQLDVSFLGLPLARVTKAGGR